jgi:multiple sugar transport system permease protein
MKQNKNTAERKEITEAYIFNAPLLIISLAFIVAPVIGTVVTSLFRDVTFMSDKFIALSNYSRLLADSHFLQAVKFTLLFVIVSVSLELLLGINFALILNESFKGRGWLRVVILIPWAIPIAISGRIWELIYNYSYGLFNFLLLQGGFSEQPVSWLGTTTGAFFAIVISDVWKTTPFISIIILAGLSTIPDDLYKQARIDGTHFVQRFFHITLPLLKPVIVVALLFRTIDAIRIFDLVYVLTGGGPGGSTTSLSLYAYTAYVSGDFGHGSAASVVVFILAAALAILYIKFGRFRQEVIS